MSNLTSHLRRLLRLKFSRASAFCRARSNFNFFCSFRSACLSTTLTIPTMQANAATPQIIITGVDTSIGPMEWFVLSVWVFAMCFLANIVFHWLYAPFIERITQWLSERDEVKGDQP